MSNNIIYCVGVKKIKYFNGNDKISYILFEIDKETNFDYNIGQNREEYFLNEEDILYEYNWEFWENNEQDGDYQYKEVSRTTSGQRIEYFWELSEAQEELITKFFERY